MSTSFPLKDKLKMLQQGEIYFRKSAAQSVSCPEKNNIWQIFILLLLRKFGLDGWGLPSQTNGSDWVYVGLVLLGIIQPVNRQGPSSSGKESLGRRNHHYPTLLPVSKMGRGGGGGRNKIRQCFQLYPHMHFLVLYLLLASLVLSTWHGLLNPVFISCLT